MQQMHDAEPLQRAGEVAIIFTASRDRTTCSSSNKLPLIELEDADAARVDHLHPIGCANAWSGDVILRCAELVLCHELTQEKINSCRA